MRDKLKKEILSDLYCLRAGMSMISIESERLNSGERDLKDVKYKIEDNTAEIMTYDSIVKNSKHSLRDAKKDYELAKREYNKKSYPSFFWSLITVALMVIDVFLYFEKAKSELYGVLLIVSLAATAFAFLNAFIKGLKIRPIKKRMKKAKEMMNNSEIWIRESSIGIKTVEKENRGLKARKSDLEVTGDDLSIVSVPMAEAINCALKDTFSSLLRVSYWKNLDLIIYLLKTDKAESIREAILAVDKTFKNGVYGNQLEKAHQALASTVGRDMDMLEPQLSASYNKLSLKLKSENATLASKILKEKKRSFAFANDVSAYLERSSSACALKDAFMRKIGSNTFELYSDMNSILTRDSSFK